MSGPQVIEVVVIDSDINDTDEAKGEPDVTVNGKILRMVQAVDGNWYGYFADRNMAQIADSTSTVDGEGLDFGTFCEAGFTMTDGTTVVTFTDTVGVAIPDGTVGIDGTNPPTVPIPPATCGALGAGSGGAPGNNVVREAKGPNLGAPNAVGQIGVDSTLWPFIQLYPLNPTGNVVVQYNKGGGVQTTTLTFDSVDQFAGASLDRTIYTPGSQVHATITDLWLNIDPTDEDSWTFGTTGTGSESASTTNYQVFDENGSQVGDTVTNTDTNTLTAQLSNLMCEDNCRLITNADVQKKGYVITLQDNDDSEIRSTLLGANSENSLSWNTLNEFLDDGTTGNVPVTITEQGPNSGVFGSYDESDASNIVITKNALRGTSASITYNEDSYSIVVGLCFGSIVIITIDDEW
jgi:hypothetical protein